MAGLSSNSRFSEIFLRQVLEAADNPALVEETVKSSQRIHEPDDLLIRGIALVPSSDSFDGFDPFTLSRIMNLQALSLNRKINQNLGSAIPDAGLAEPAGLKPLTEMELSFLLFLFNHSPENRKNIVEIFCLHIEEISWFKSSINRWIKGPDLQFDENSLPACAVHAMHKVGSEEYIPELVKVLSNGFGNDPIISAIEALILKIRILLICG